MGARNRIDTTYFDPARFDNTARDTLRKELNIAADDPVFCFVKDGDEGNQEI